MEGTTEFANGKGELNLALKLLRYATTKKGIGLWKTKQ